MTLDEIYDLKGSYVDRRTITKQSVRSRTGGVRKDMDLRRVFHVGDAKDSIKWQLKSDVEFLESHNLMDYSMMVGVHTCESNGACCMVRRGAEAGARKQAGEMAARRMYVYAPPVF